MLTSILNSAPIFPEEDGAEDIHFLTGDNYQCVMFALFMIWFSSITINLGPTFLSGALAANADAHMLQPSCPLVQVSTVQYSTVQSVQYSTVTTIQYIIVQYSTVHF